MKSCGEEKTGKVTLSKCTKEKSLRYSLTSSPLLSGATPDYRGRGDATDFLLYDGATGFSGHTDGAALYYPNAMELTFACIELSAMGAKAVAKLAAKRLGWIKLPKVSNMGEEL